MALLKKYDPEVQLAPPPALAVPSPGACFIYESHCTACTRKVWSLNGSLHAHWRKPWHPQWLPVSKKCCANVCRLSFPCFCPPGLRQRNVHPGGMPPQPVKASAASALLSTVRTWASFAPACVCRAWIWLHSLFLTKQHTPRLVLLPPCCPFASGAGLREHAGHQPDG